MRFGSEYNPLVSIIIPVKNGSGTIQSCLHSVHRSYYKKIEVIVVDDHSTDGTKELVQPFGVTLIEADEGTGANNARNLGARHAHGDVLIFIDSDIVIHRETILGIVERLEEEDVDAIVGLYTAKHRHENLITQYKNLWVRYSYIKSPPAIDWLFGAISGIKRDAFNKLGGFNIDLLAVHGNDDIELGKRFSRADLSIRLDMDIEVEHLKQYTLWSFIKNEFNRSSGFARLAVNLGEAGSSVKKGFVNVYPAFVLSTLAVAALAVLVVLCFIGMLPPAYLLGAFGLYLLLNIRFLNYLEQVRGLFAMLFMVPFLVIDHAVCFVGSIVGVIKGLIGGK